jgi:DNA mismatch repair ATPase MutS
MDLSTPAEESFYTAERQSLINTIEQLREKIRMLESERFEKLTSNTEDSCKSSRQTFDKDFYMYHTYT